ncbi:MAG: S8 family serine peptidase [Planctomycetota bacterium]
MLPVGATLLSILDEQRYLVALSPSDWSSLAEHAAVADLQLVQAEDKIDASLHTQPPAWSMWDTTDPDDPIIAVIVQFYSDITLADGIALLHATGGQVLSSMSSINAAVVALPFSRVGTVAQLDAVAHVESPLPALTPNNDLNRQVTQVELVQTGEDYGLGGTGIRIMLYDGGSPIPDHPDFDDRVSVNDAVQFLVHSTHVAGTMVGSGLASGGIQRGMAPHSMIESFAVENLGGSVQELLFNNPGDLEEDYTTAFATLGVMLANNSIGTNVCANGFDCTWTGNYGATSALIDSLVAGSLGTPVRVVWAAGNERSCDRCTLEGVVDITGYGTLPPPSGAKNPIVVGATNADTNEVTAFSSFGPTDDGRLKPDLVAPGCQITDDYGVTSTTLLGGYDSICGTSMSTPTVTGGAALLLEAYSTAYPGRELPGNAMLKAILVQTAQDIDRPGPDYRSGFGLVQIADAIDVVRSGNHNEDEIAESQVHGYFLDVTDSREPVRVTLAWDDPPAAPLAEFALVNDLDLRVTDPTGQRHYPWTLDPLRPQLPATRDQRDSLNNVEQVFVENPVPGRWLVEVTGTRVLVTTAQAYAVVLTSDHQRDCNDNGIDDHLEIEAEPSLDCTANRLLDACETDCDLDGLADSCEIQGNPLRDCDGDGTPNACETIVDCNDNGTDDACEILDGLAADCNSDLIPDECNIDCDDSGTPDACEIASSPVLDCNANGVLDTCETLPDCNGNGVADACDIVDGSSADRNSNGTPDECDPRNITRYAYPGECQHPGSGTAEDPFCTIQYAVNHSLDGDTIILAPGTYTGEENRNIDFAGRLLRLTSADPSNPAVVGATVIDCEYMGRAFFFHNGETQDAIVDGITITRGLSAVGSTPSPFVGGAIYCKQSSPVIRRCVISSGLVAPTIFFFFGGGGLFCEQSDALIEDCHFSGNLSPAFGGAAYFYDNSHATVRGCTFSDNFAGFGGAVACGASSSPQFDRCVFRDNTAAGNGNGGAMTLWGESHPEIRSCLFDANVAGAAGGAVFMTSDCVPSIVASTLYGNQADDGGAVAASTRSMPFISSSVLWNNGDGSGLNQLAAELESVLSVQYSDVQGGEEAIQLEFGASVDWGFGNLDVDPDLLDPAGGMFELTSTSPAANAGDPDLEIIASETDLAGLPRLRQCRIDIGAFESDFFDDCNNNTLVDACEVVDGLAVDCDSNGSPDSCQDTTTDCNGNGTWDACDIAAGAADDCNINLVPDDCEIASGTADDCNGNGTLDSCDLASGESGDVNANQVPDECESCESNAQCDDGVFCNGAEICVNNVCQTGNDPCPARACSEGNQTCFDCLIDLDCDDDNACTSEVCNHGTCITTLLDGPCNDGESCTTNDACIDGQCQGAIIEGCGVAIRLKAVAVDGVPLDNGPVSDLTVFNPSTITLEIFIDGWDPESLQLFNVAIDGDSYSSGPSGTLSPLVDPSPSAGAFLDQGREDFVFHDLDIIAGVFNGDPSLYQFGAFVLFTEDCVTDSGQTGYLGTLVLQASEDAAGPFRICPNSVDSDFDYSPDFTFLFDCNTDVITPVEIDCVDILVVADCNNNGISDDIDIADGTSEDCAGEGFPDECEPDCNNNGEPDSCDIFNGTHEDCNANDIPDDCDLSAGQSGDCNLNSIPDECEDDCNANGKADSCDIADGTSMDCDGLGVPDECEDCNENGIGDICDLENGTEPDCNANDVPDSCDIADSSSNDCDQNSIPDECQPTDEDCNGNGIWDQCDFFAGTSADCNENLVPDECDIASDQSRDCDGNHLPDECQDFFPPLIDPEEYDGIRGFRLDGQNEDARMGGSVHAAGDFNQDGIGDFIVGSPGAYDIQDESVGEAYLVYGSVGVGSSSINLSTDAVTFRGREPGDDFGNSVSGGGDFNGDGISDILIGAWGVNVDEDANHGEAYIVFGSTNSLAGQLLRPAWLDGINGFILRGANSGDFTGQSVDFAGDINNDGFDDIMIGAHTWDLGEQSSTGRVYVVYGNPGPHSTLFPLADLDPANGGDGTRGFILQGADASDQTGFSLSAAGDVNGDGFDDMLVGAYPAAPDEMPFAGKTYLVFGGSNPGGIGLLDLAGLDGTDGVTFHGIDGADLSSHHLSHANDVNDDGFDDFMIAAIWADPGGRLQAGEIYVIYGHDNAWPAVYALSVLLPENGGDGTLGTILNGIDSNDLAGYGLGLAGDVNVDGHEDLIIGAYLGDIPEANSVGEAYVLYGSSEPWPAVIELSETVRTDLPDDQRIGFALRGKVQSEFLGFAATGIGDINADGAADFATGSPGLDVDEVNNIGRMYVTFGRYAEPLDCNQNDILDQCDLIDMVSTDCDENLIPDECQENIVDCNGNGTWDFCDLLTGSSLDCNGNAVPDRCDVESGTSEDCNDNKIPDTCEDGEQPDCNGNSQWDGCDIFLQTSTDCNQNRVPDECEPGGTSDCNENGQIDLCDLYQSLSIDANVNAIPDECEPIENLHVDVNACDESTGGSGTPLDPFCDIASAIVAAPDGLTSLVTILVAPGSYTGSANRNLRFAEGLPAGETRSLELQCQGESGSCVIDTGGIGGAFQFDGGETRGARVRGFTILNTLTGALTCIDSSPLIEDCVLTQNFRTGGGAGVLCINAAPLISRCVISGNYVNGIGCEEGSAPHILNSIVAGNHGGFGGGIYAIEESAPVIASCTVADNTAQWAGGAIFSVGANTPSITNSILFGNTPDSTTGSAIVTFSVAETEFPGETNLTVDPLFELTLTGTWTAVAQPTDHPQQFEFIDENADFVEDALVGAFVITDLDSPVQLSFPIVANTSTSVTIWSNGFLLAVEGGAYRINGYELQSESPVINAGDIAIQPPLAPASDVAGGERVQQCRIDMGAIESTFGVDCDGDGVTDACDALASLLSDCNENAVPDSCEPNCNNNAFPDPCEILRGSAADVNSNGIPDDCELSLCDLDSNGVIDTDDRDLMRECLYDLESDIDVCPNIDLNGDGVINIKDADAFSACYQTFLPRPGRSSLGE